MDKGADMADDIFFAEEEGEGGEPFFTPSFWPVLVVDDEPDVFDITRLALSNYQFNNAGLEMESALSAGEALEKLRQREYAIVLCDMIMEEDEAGMEVISFIRKTQRNYNTRIILRSGQPGMLDVEECLKADINEFIAKTDLTNSRLKQLMHRHLRDYAIATWYLDKLEAKNRELSRIRQYLEEGASSSG